MARLDPTPSEMSNPSSADIPSPESSSGTDSMPSSPGSGSGSSNSGPRIARRTLLMSGGTVISRVTGLARVLAVIYALGTLGLADAYNLANNLPNVIYELILGGVLSATMVPIFSELAGTKDRETANNSMRSIFTLTWVIAGLVSAIVAITAPWIINAYTFSNTEAAIELKRDVATFLLRLFAIQILFYGIATVSIAYLNTKRKFVASTFTPIFNNILVIGVLIGTPQLINGLRNPDSNAVTVASAVTNTNAPTKSGAAPSTGVATIATDPTLITDSTLAAAKASTKGLIWLGLGTTAGVAAISISMLCFALRAGLTIRPRWNFKDRVVKEIARLSGWTLGFVIANQVSLFVISVLALRVDGDLSIYQYSYSFFLLPHGIFAVSVMTGLLPELSDSWRRGRIDEFRSMVSRGVRLISLVLVPAGCGLALVAPLILRLAHSINESSSGLATPRAGATLAMLACGLPFFSCYLYLMRCFQAMKNTRAMFFHYAVENAVNITLALAVYSKHGVQGLAASTSIAYAVGCLTAGFDLARRLKAQSISAFVLALGRIVMLSGFMCGVVIVALRAFEDFNTASQLAIGTLAGAICFAVLAWMFIPETDELLPRRFRKRTRTPNELPTTSDLR